MVISIRPSGSDPETLRLASAETEVKSPEQVAAVEAAEEVIAAVGKPAIGVVRADGASLLVRLARSIAAVYDDLSGPPMTQRDRVHEKIEKSAAERKYGPWPI